jgi:hypothetical protein
VPQPGTDSQDALAGAIADRGNLLTFCDSFTIVPGETADSRVTLEGWVGVTVEPVHYVHASQALENLLAVAGVRTFRLDEVVYRRKAWAERSREERLRWVEVLCHHALHWIKRVDVLMLHAQEHGTMARLQLAERQFTGTGLAQHKVATETYFLRLLVGHLVLDNPGRQVVLVTADTPRWKTVCQDLSLPEVSLYGGRLFNLPPSEVIGLQLADLCAYAVSRAHHLKQRMERGTELGPFDTLTLTFWDTLVAGGRTYNLRYDIPGVSPTVPD